MKTPGTRIYWTTVREWVEAWWCIHRRHISSQRFRQEEAHLLALLAAGDEFLATGSRDDLGDVIFILKREQPAKGMRAGHITTLLLDVAHRARHARRHRPHGESTLAMEDAR